MITGASVAKHPSALLRSLFPLNDFKSASDNRELMGCGSFQGIWIFEKKRKGRGKKEVGGLQMVVIDSPGCNTGASYTARKILRW